MRLPREQEEEAVQLPRRCGDGEPAPRQRNDRSEGEVQEQVEALKAVYGEWGKGNFWTPEIFAPDVEIIWAAEMPDQTTAHGLAEVSTSMRDWLAPWENYRWTADEFIPIEGGVLVLLTARGHGKGSTVD